MTQAPCLRAATISRDDRYRYDLTRDWVGGHRVLWVLLNPSTADGTVDDPTVRRCMGFTRRGGYGGMTIVNLFAYRCTRPKELLSVSDPVGPENAATIRRWMFDPSIRMVVAGWGAWWKRQPGRPERPAIEQVAREAGHDVWCLGRSNDGSPRHPLYLPKEQEFELFWPSC